MISIENLQETLTTVLSDVEKFNNGNKSAGTRIRKAMQTLKGQAQDLRKEVQEIKNNN
jgi:hypothetical protein